MKRLFFLVSLVVLLTQGCSQDDFVDEMFIIKDRGKQVEMRLPIEIEAYGRAIAAEIRATVTNMVERGIDYSEIPDSVDFRERFYSDWCAANPKTNQTRSAQTKFLLQMSASDFAEKYQMLTAIQIDFINKIINECKESSSYDDLLKRLVVLKEDICLHVPEIEQERLLNIISVLYFSVQTISEMKTEGLMLRTPHDYNDFQSVQVKTRAVEGGVIDVPFGCQSFLTTVWTIAVGEPTPFGEIVASVVTVVVAGTVMYEVITCKDEDTTNEELEKRKYCAEKYTQCMEDPELSKPHSGSTWGISKCADCLHECISDGYWDCK